jgi:hypothetical protein
LPPSGFAQVRCRFAQLCRQIRGFCHSNAELQAALELKSSSDRTQVACAEVVVKSTLP